jgi:hypothetical protein
MMKFIQNIALVVLSAGVLSSCTKSDYPGPQTSTPAAYTHELRDDFNSDTHNWSFTDSITVSSIFLNNGMLYFNAHPKIASENYATIIGGFSPAANFMVETSLSSDNQMGIVLGNSDTVNGYSFKIDDKGNYALYNEGTQSFTASPIVNWQFSNAINKATNNVLRLEQVGASWFGYINGIEVFVVSAHPLVNNHAGFVLAGGTNGQADYLDIKW